MASCQSTPPDQRTYLVLGHPYNWKVGNRLDPRLEKLDYKQFDQVWLGGDVCGQLTQSPATLDYLDSLLDLGSGKVHWTLGNHDVKYGNTQYITNKTGHPTFYTSWEDGICLLVLNTNLFWLNPWDAPLENCTEKQAQVDLMRQVTDTIQQASHLVIFHHHALLNELKLDSAGQLIKVFNVNPASVQMSCDSTSSLTEWLYPRLEAIQKRGVQVVLIGGDLGMRAKSFEYTTPEGITLLGTGINNSLDASNPPDYVTNFDPDQVLILHHQPDARKLSWEFVFLDSLGASEE
ncbi:MAG: hypothetical protein DHS20C18_18920 [Saprospiraceae bacterium]|nr:MAG: hypothetical protein DHS20C18_18920 [Saprospiraceae bacterium]